LNLRGIQAAWEKHRQYIPLDLDTQIVVGQQVFDHLAVTDIVSEFLVGRFHQEIAAELGRFKINVVEAQELANLVEEAFTADEQLGKVSVEVEDEE